jgi:hypothetical protein
MLHLWAPSLLEQGAPQVLLPTHSRKSLGRHGHPACTRRRDLPWSRSAAFRAAKVARSFRWITLAGRSGLPYGPDAVIQLNLYRFRHDDELKRARQQARYRSLANGAVGLIQTAPRCCAQFYRVHAAEAVPRARRPRTASIISSHCAPCVSGDAIFAHLR